MTFAPENYDQRKPTPGPVVGERSPAPGRVEVDCLNCRGDQSGSSRNYVPELQSRFQCWHCGQQQSVAAALGFPPQDWDDVLRTAGVRAGGRS